MIDVYWDAEWEHGLTCAQCGVLFVNGQRISHRLEGFQDEYPILLVVCEACGLAGEAPAESAA